MWSLPGAVKVGDDWFVIFESEMVDDVAKFGETCFESKTIRINKNLSTKMKKRTLAHELDHACNPDKNEDAILRLEYALVSAGIV